MKLKLRQLSVFQLNSFSQPLKKNVQYRNYSTAYKDTVKLKNDASNISDTSLNLPSTTLKSFGTKTSYWNIKIYKNYDNVCVLEMNSNKVNCFTYDWLSSFKKSLKFIEDHHPGKSIILKSASPKIFSSGMDLKLVNKIQEIHHNHVKETYAQIEPCMNPSREMMAAASENIVHEYFKKHPHKFEQLTTTSIIPSIKNNDMDTLYRSMFSSIEYDKMTQIKVPYSLNLEYISNAIDYIGEFNDVFLKFLIHPNPTFSFVSGAALAGGLALSVSADGLAVVNPTKIGLHARSLGFCFPSSIHYVLNSRFTDQRNSYEIMLMGRSVSSYDELHLLTNHLTINNFESLLKHANKLSKRPVSRELKQFQIDNMKHYLEFNHASIQVRFLNSFLFGIGPKELL